MSYEGYDQHICENGHQFSLDAMNYDNYMGNAKCHICKAESVWSLAVDQTNDEGFPYTNFVEIEPKKHETCEHCGHTKLISEATYRVPTEEEMKQYEEEGKKFYDKMCAFPPVMTTPPISTSCCNAGTEERMTCWTCASCDTIVGYRG